MNWLLSSHLRSPSLCAAMLAILVATDAKAAPVAVNNFSFEDPVAADAALNTATPTGWTTSGGSGTWKGVYNPTNTQFAGATGSPGTLPSPANGAQAAFFQYNGAVGYLFQNVGALLPDTQYTLTAAVGHRLDNSSDVTAFAGLVNGIDLTGTPLSSNTFAFINGTSTKGVFTDLVASFMTGSSVSGDLTIAIGVTAGTNRGNAPQMVMDNVRLDATPIPEPSSIVLILVALMVYGRRPAAKSLIRRG
jgi:hypothetical protein